MGCAGSTAAQVEGRLFLVLVGILLTFYLGGDQWRSQDVSSDKASSICMRILRKYRNQNPGSILSQLLPHNLSKCVMNFGTQPLIMVAKKVKCKRKPVQFVVYVTEIWDALRAAAEADLNLAQVIVDSAGIIISNADLTLCYDERGAKYELPKYVLSDPANLIREN